MTIATLLVIACTVLLLPGGVLAAGPGHIGEHLAGPAPQTVLGDDEAAESLDAEGLRVHYRRVPCHPSEPAGDVVASPSGPERPWLVALLDVGRRFRSEGIDLHPGSYALVCHPAAGSDRVPTVELRRLRNQPSLPPEPTFLEAFDGEALARAPVQFDLARATTPRLTIRLTPRPGRLTLDVRYGDWGMVRDFEP